MESVSERGLDQNIPTVVAWLHIPDSKKRQLRRQYPVFAQRRRVYSSSYLAHVPGPSWKTVATALWRTKELGALEVVQKLYLKGEPCTDNCRIVRRMCDVLSAD